MNSKGTFSLLSFLVKNNFRFIVCSFLETSPFIHWVHFWYIASVWMQFLLSISSWLRLDHHCFCSALSKTNRSLKKRYFVTALSTCNPLGYQFKLQFVSHLVIKNIPDEYVLDKLVHFTKYCRRNFFLFCKLRNKFHCPPRMTLIQLVNKFSSSLPYFSSLISKGPNSQQTMNNAEKICSSQIWWRSSLHLCQMT